MASLHYSTDYADDAARSAARLRRQVRLVILDSPMYTDPTSGARMVHEREARFRRAYGFASDALPSEHYLTPARLDELAARPRPALAGAPPGLAGARRWRGRRRRAGRVASPRASR